MSGRPIPTEPQMIAAGYGRADMVRRREVLRETLGRLATPSARRDALDRARQNLGRWRAAAQDMPAGQVRVIEGDWGDVTLQLTREIGACFAVLNMANAFVPGGGYVEGMVAQEENMYRRTDCHFHIGPGEYDAAADQYLPWMTELLEARAGRVFLDTDTARVCLRGPEIRSRGDLGYDWLPEDRVFPFYELRASAQDLRGSARFDPDEARRRIAAQLNTLRERGLRHAVLGAFGCGAFLNPPEIVARLYREEIDRRRDDFALIAFAIYSAGYGPDNYTPFAAALA